MLRVATRATQNAFALPRPMRLARHTQEYLRPVPVYFGQYIGARRFAAPAEDEDDYSLFDDDPVIIPDVDISDDSDRASNNKKPVQNITKRRSGVTRRRIPDQHKIPRVVAVPNAVTPKSLAALFGARTVDILKELIYIGVDVKRADFIMDENLVDLIALEYNVTIKRQDKSKRHYVVEPDLTKIGDTENFTKRSPIVTVMGHVDHGKTTLMDTIRHTSVAAGEAGGITQHISAFQVEAGGELMTFIDTPGHAAFSKMRLRSTQVADIVILVIAADAGIQQQTEEVINNILATEVPFVVALNKCDRDNANPGLVIDQLASRGVVVEQKGGDIQCVEISAKEGTNVDELIQCVQMQSEFDNSHLFVDYDAKAEAYVLDVFKEKGRGISATCLVYTGSLHAGDVFVCGTTWGKVKIIRTRDGENLTVGEPSIPMSVVGFKGEDLPAPGDELIVIDNEKRAQEVVAYRKHSLSKEGQADLIQDRIIAEKKQQDQLLSAARQGFEQAQQFIEETKQAKHFVEEHDDEKTINVIIKADVPGSIEGLESAIAEIPAEKYGYQVCIMSAKIGPVSEVDVDAAKSSNAFLLSFNQKVPHPVQVYARQESIEIQKANIIYSVVDDLVSLVEDRLPKTEKHVNVGRAIVQMSFMLFKHKKKKRKSVAGCVVDNGIISRSAKVLARLIRDKETIFVGPVESLQHHKDSVNEVKKGQECGIRIAEWDDYQAEDIIEIFETHFIKTEINWKYTKNATEFPSLEKE